jgi:hypothetical protein
VSDEADISKLLSEVKRTLAEAIDFAMVGRIEELDGRVPSRDEMNRHIFRLVHIPSGENHFFYKGRLILVVVPPNTPNGKFILKTT